MPKPIGDHEEILLWGIDTKHALNQNRFTRIVVILFCVLLQCSNGGCLIELAQQLAVIMVGKQIINNAQEILIPKLKAWWHNKKVINPN